MTWLFVTHGWTDMCNHKWLGKEDHKSAWWSYLKNVSSLSNAKVIGSGGQDHSLSGCSSWWVTWTDTKCIVTCGVPLFFTHNMIDRWRVNVDIPGVAQVMSAAHGMTGHIGGGHHVQSLVNKLLWPCPVSGQLSFMADWLDKLSKLILYHRCDGFRINSRKS